MTDYALTADLACEADGFLVGNHTTFNYGALATSGRIGWASMGDAPSRFWCRFNPALVDNGGSHALLKISIATGATASQNFTIFLLLDPTTITEGTGSGSATGDGATWAKRNAADNWTAAAVVRTSAAVSPGMDIDLTVSVSCRMPTGTGFRYFDVSSLIARARVLGQTKFAFLIVGDNESAGNLFLVDPRELNPGGGVGLNAAKLICGYRVAEITPNADTFISSLANTTNNDGATVGSGFTLLTTDIRRALQTADISDLMGTTIVEARLMRTSSSASVLANGAKIRRCLSDGTTHPLFTEAGATWDKRDGINNWPGSVGSSTAATDYTVTNEKAYTQPTATSSPQTSLLTDIMQDAINAAIPVLATQDMSDDETTALNYWEWHPRTAATTWFRPLIRTVYQSVLSTVTTTTPTAIKSTSATAGGNVTRTGGAPSLARGVCWTIDGTAPTLSNKAGFTTNSTGSGAFTSSMTGLPPSTSIKVAAYSTTGDGTSYGSVSTFSTPALVGEVGSILECVQAILPSKTKVDIGIQLGVNDWTGWTIRVDHAASAALLSSSPTSTAEFDCTASLVDATDADGEMVRRDDITGSDKRFYQVVLTDPNAVVFKTAATRCCYMIGNGVKYRIGAIADDHRCLALNGRGAAPAETIIVQNASMARLGAYADADDPIRFIVHMGDGPEFALVESSLGLFFPVETDGCGLSVAVPTSAKVTSLAQAKEMIRSYKKQNPNFPWGRAAMLLCIGNHGASSADFATERDYVIAAAIYHGLIPPTENYRGYDAPAYGGATPIGDCAFECGDDTLIIVNAGHDQVNSGAAQTDNTSVAAYTDIIRSSDFVTWITNAISTSAQTFCKLYIHNTLGGGIQGAHPGTVGFYGRSDVNDVETGQYGTVIAPLLRLYFPNLAWVFLGHDHIHDDFIIKVANIGIRYTYLATPGDQAGPAAVGAGPYNPSGFALGPNGLHLGTDSPGSLANAGIYIQTDSRTAMRNDYITTRVVTAPTDYSPGPTNISNFADGAIVKTTRVEVPGESGIGRATVNRANVRRPSYSRPSHNRRL